MASSSRTTRARKRVPAPVREGGAVELMPLPTKAKRFGLILRAARLRRRLSVRKLAEAIGRSSAFISQLEQAPGRPAIKPETIAALASALAVPEDDLFLAASRVPPGAIPATSTELFVLRAFRRLSAKAQATCVAFLDGEIRKGTRGTPARSAGSRRQAPGKGSTPRTGQRPAGRATRPTAKPRQRTR